MRGHIQKRQLAPKNGKPCHQYHIVYDIGFREDPKTGAHRRRQKWESVPPPNTRKHAEQLLAERLSQVHGGTFVEPRKVTFGDYSGIWETTYARGNVRPSTLDKYRSIFRTHLVPNFGSDQLSKITVEQIQAYSSEKLAGGLSPQSVRHHLQLLRQMFNHGIDWQYSTSNPALKVPYPKIPRCEMECLSAAEVRLVLEHVPARWLPFIITAVTTGMRMGELLAMKWSHVSWHEGRYFIREIYTRKRETQPAGFAPPKTPGSMQSVDLTPHCMEALKGHRKAQAMEKLAAGASYDDQDLIFATTAGKPLNDRNVVHRVFEPALKSAGLRRVKFHTLRHTAASLLIAQNASAKYVQRQLRHASVRTTFDLYGHLFPEAHSEATQRLDEQLFGPELAESRLTAV